MSDLALTQAHAQLNSMHERFEALAQVAGREMPRYLKPAYTVPLTIGVAALGAAAEARFGAKGMIANAIGAALAYGVGMMAGDNADLRAGAYMFATGLGSAAAAVATNDKIIAMRSGAVAPASLPPPAQ